MDPNQWSEAVYDAVCSPSKIRAFATYIDQSIDLAYADEQYQRILSVIDAKPPRLMVVDCFELWAVDAALARGIPFVLSVSVPVSGLFAAQLPWGYPTPLSGFSTRMTFRQRVANVAFRIARGALFVRPKFLREFAASVRRRKEAGLPPSSLRGSRYLDAASAVLAYSVFGIEYPFPAPEKLSMVGAAVSRTEVDDDRPTELNRWIDEHSAVLYVAFGSVSRLTESQIGAIVDAVAHLDPAIGVLWVLPESRRHLLPAGELPGNLRLCDWVPSQAKVLSHPHVKAFFNHGGGNSVNEGLYFGKPMLIMPTYLDSFDLAVRTVDSGAALKIESPREVRADEIVAKLNTLLTDDRFRQRAEHWAGVQRQAGGVPKAAEIISNIVRAQNS